MVDTLHKRTELLKEKYLEIVKKLENTIAIDAMSLSIPRIVSQFQFTYSDILNELYIVSDKMEEKFYTEMFNYKIGNSELSHISLGTSENKRMIEASKEYRKLKMQKEMLTADLKIIEEFITTIKAFNFNVSSAIKFRELVND